MYFYWSHLLCYVYFIYEMQASEAWKNDMLQDEIYPILTLILQSNILQDQKTTVRSQRFDWYNFVIKS